MRWPSARTTTACRSVSDMTGSRIIASATAGRRMRPGSPCAWLRRLPIRIARCATTCGCSASCSARRCAARRDRRSSTASSACARWPNGTRGRRQAATASRRWPSELRAMPVDSALPIARSFAHFLNLANVAEQHHRVRRRRAYQRDPRARPQPGSIEEALPRLLSSGIGADALHDAVCSLRIELVVTAHPTEIMRALAAAQVPPHCRGARRARSQRRHVPRARDADRNPAPGDHRGLGDRRSAARAAVAARRGAFGAGRLRRNAVGRAAAVSAARSIARCVQSTGRGLPLDAAPIRFGSWIGGDRDGNPSVTPDVTRRACLMARWTALSLYAQGSRAAALRAVDVGRERRSCVAQVEGAHEPYRALLRALQQRLEASRRRIEELLRAIPPERRPLGQLREPRRLYVGAGDVRAGVGADASRCASATARCTRPATASSPTAG